MSVSMSEDQGQEPQPQTPVLNPEPAAEPQPAAPVESAAEIEPVAAVEPAAEIEPVATVQPEPEPVPEPAPMPQPQPAAEPVVMERPAPEPLTIPVAEQAPLITIAKPEPQPQAKPQTDTPAAAAEGSTPLLGLPLQLVNQLLARLGAAPLASLTDLLPAIRIISLLVVAGIAVKLTGATLGAINELPLLGRLLELAGLISALNFLARNALRSQKRAELLARIQTLKRNLLG